MNIENIILLAILIFMLGVWLGARLAGGNPYASKGLRTPLQPSVPPMPNMKHIIKKEIEIKPIKKPLKLICDDEDEFFTGDVYYNCPCGKFFGNREHVPEDMICPNCKSDLEF